MKNFTSTNKISIYNHERGNSYQISINDAFTENNLNTILDNENQEDPNLIEDYYDKYFEYPASIAVNKIINDLKKDIPNGKNFTPSDFICLLKFVITGSSRHPLYIRELLYGAKLSAYIAVIFKYFDQYKTVNFPYYLKIDKAQAFAHLDKIKEGILLTADLKLTLFYHKIPNQYFLIPDKFVIIHSPNNTKYADKQLKIYMPISSNVLVCLERVDREFSKATSLIRQDDIIKFNKYVLSNFYKSIGCENIDYLNQFIKENKNEVKPLKQFDVESDDKIKNQIQTEIFQKMILKDYPSNSIITHINHNLEFKILSEEEFEIRSVLLNSTVPIKRRVYNIY